MERVDRQRGAGVFNRVIEAMRRLNSLGYAQPGSPLLLDLAYNPAGTYLPGSQAALEHEYKSRLEADHGVYFNTLFCLVNSPTGRYLEYLIRSDNLDDYMNSLHLSFNPSTVESLMCRTTLSVGWDGRLYDCDFNQMLDLPVSCASSANVHDFDHDELARRRIVTGNHCFSCTAGAGSSCQGSLR
jgi:radical SAM/Cys-rich protein